MTNDVAELYQEMIVDHGQHPRNFRVLGSPSGRADGYNPLCGDRVRVFVKLDGERVEDISFKGAGCAISIASASLMTEAIKGLTRSEALQLSERFHELVTGQSDAGRAPAALGKLQVFQGVRNYPVRVKCAVLAWHALRAAFSGEKSKTISTE